MLTGLVSVPLTLHYLGVERYGLWLTISSLIACLSFSDLGINNGLLNGIAKANGLNDSVLAQQYISSAFFFLSAIAIALGILFGAAYHWIPWKSIFHVHTSQAVAESGPAVAAFIVCYLIAIPAGIVTRVQSGYQDGATANLWSLSGSVLGFLALLVVIRLHGSLTSLVVAVSGVPMLALFANAIYFFKKRPWLRPMWVQVRRAISRELVRTGSLFLVLQLAGAIAFSADNVVIAQVLGAEAVAQYAVPARLFSVINLLSSFIVGPLWPAYGEALARNDRSWVEKTLFRSVRVLTALSIAIGGTLLAVAPTLLRLWVGPQIHPSAILLIGLASWSVICALSVPVAILLNAATVVRFQVVASSVGCLGNILLSVWLTRRLGVSGVIYGSIISQLLLVLVPYWLYVPRFLKS